MTEEYFTQEDLWHMLGWVAWVRRWGTVRARPGFAFVWIKGQTRPHRMVLREDGRWDSC